MVSIGKSSPADHAVSVVVPVRNGARWLPDVLAAIHAGLADREHEILVVDDGSEDASIRICETLGGPRLAVIAGPRRGAAAAVNEGLRHARYQRVAQIDQDVIVQPGWFATLAAALDDPSVAAAQGWYATDRSAPLVARVMSLDLEQRYARIAGGASDHVCTGNVMWRLPAVRDVGLLDETLGYGYDNDLSYRLIRAGHRLVICPRARSFHRWRDSWLGYLRQQYGFGYGRIDLVARHRTRMAGDAVSPPLMMAHPLLMLLAIFCLVIAAGVGLTGGAAARWLAAATAIVLLLAVERAVAGIAATAKWRDPAALLFPVAHLGRDLAWCAAVVSWLARRFVGSPEAPAHSMQPREVITPVPASTLEER